MADGRKCEFQAMQCSSRNTRSDKHFMECVQLRFAVSEHASAYYRIRSQCVLLVDATHNGFHQKNVGFAKQIGGPGKYLKVKAFGNNFHYVRNGQPTF